MEWYEVVVLALIVGFVLGGPHKGDGW